MRLLSVLIVISWPMTVIADEQAEKLLTTIRQVAPGNGGQQEAQSAWKELVQHDAESLPTLLSRLDGANPLAANCMRSAIDAITEKSLANGQNKLPIGALETFLNDRSHDPRGRRLAYELILKAEPTAADRLKPKLIDDPSPELRRDAVSPL
jgi:hypothetical protein